MVAVSEISWEEVADPAFGNPARRPGGTRWRRSLTRRTRSCRSATAVLIGRSRWCSPGDVEVLADGTARVASQSNGTTAYQVVNGHCECRDFEKAPHQFCKHRLGAAIARRAQDLLQGQESGTERPGRCRPALRCQRLAAVAALLPESLLPYVVHIKGKAFIQYGGLLTLAQQRGLVSLKVDFISVTSELALARAEAVFADGRGMRNVRMPPRGMSARRCGRTSLAWR